MTPNIFRKATLATAAVLLCLATTLAGCDGNNAGNQQQQHPDTLVGNTASTSAATNTDGSLLDVKMPDGTVVQRIDYDAITVYFSNSLRIPLCVAYELTSTKVSMADAPDAERRENYKFNRDKRVKGCPEWWELKNSGYTRGHMAPAMDMRWDKQAMSDCFLMTNICPQLQELNDGEWRHTEEAVHRWARNASRLYVYTGPVMGANPKHTGSKNDITVPDGFYKVVYDTQHNRAIAFYFDHRAARSSWTAYAVTVDEVERRTGINFLATLPDDVETRLESRQDIRQWPKYTPRR